MNEQKQKNLMHFFFFMWKLYVAFCRLRHGLQKELLSTRTFLVMVIYGMLLWLMAASKRQRRALGYMLLV
jgi:hypothetical protein